MVLLEVEHDAVDGLEALVESHALEGMRSFLHRCEHVLVQLAVDESLHVLLERVFLLGQDGESAAYSSALEKERFDTVGVRLARALDNADAPDDVLCLEVEGIFALGDFLERIFESYLGRACCVEVHTAEEDLHGGEPAISHGVEALIWRSSSHAKAALGLYMRRMCFVFLRGVR